MMPEPAKPGQANPTIRTIFWDVGGVLLTNGWDHSERKAVLDNFGVDIGPVEERHPGPNDLWEKGKISVWQYLDETVFFEPRSFTPQAFFECMKQQSRVLHAGSIGILRRVAESQHHRVCILNNESAELHDYRMEKFGLRGLFDAAFCSAYVGLRKPDTAIFQMALRVMETTPEQAVFIDDRTGNAEAAAALGVHAIRFESPEQLAEELKSLGVDADL